MSDASCDGLLWKRCYWHRLSLKQCEGEESRVYWPKTDLTVAHVPRTTISLSVYHQSHTHPCASSGREGAWTAEIQPQQHIETLNPLSTHAVIPLLLYLFKCPSALLFFLILQTSPVFKCSCCSCCCYIVHVALFTVLVSVVYTHTITKKNKFNIWGKVTQKGAIVHFIFGSLLFSCSNTCKLCIRHKRGCFAPFWHAVGIAGIVGKEYQNSLGTPICELSLFPLKTGRFLD